MLYEDELKALGSLYASFLLEDDWPLYVRPLESVVPANLTRYLGEVSTSNHPEAVYSVLVNLNLAQRLFLDLYRNMPLRVYRITADGISYIESYLSRR